MPEARSDIPNAAVSGVRFRRPFITTPPRRVRPACLTAVVINWLFLLLADVLSQQKDPGAFPPCDCTLAVLSDVTAWGEDGCFWSFQMGNHVKFVESC